VTIEEASSLTLRSGERIFYRGQLSNSEKPIILLHGLSQQLEYWQPVQQKLLRSCIAVDLRGHGESQDFDLSSDFSVDRVSQDIIELMDSLRIPSAHIVGHSWGASIALRIAVTAPLRTESCTLIDGGVFNPRDLIPSAVDSTEELRKLLTPPRGPFTREMLINHYQELDQANGSSIMTAVSRTYVDHASGGYVTRLGLERHMLLLDALIAYDHICDIQKIRVPTWVVNCLAGDYWDQVKANIVPLLLKNHLIHVQNWYSCHHDVPLQRPTAVAELISHIATLTHD